MNPNECPFCGSGFVDSGVFPIACCNCGASGPQGYEGEIATWLTRPREDGLRRQLAAVAKERDALKAKHERATSMIAALQRQLAAALEDNERMSKKGGGDGEGEEAENG